MDNTNNQQPNITDQGSSDNAQSMKGWANQVNASTYSEPQTTSPGTGTMQDATNLGSPAQQTSSTQSNFTSSGTSQTGVPLVTTTPGNASTPGSANTQGSAVNTQPEKVQTPPVYNRPVPEAQISTFDPNLIGSNKIIDQTQTADQTQTSSIQQQTQKPLQPQTQTTPEVQPITQEEPNYEEPNYSEPIESPRSKSKILLIVLLVLAILFALGSAVYYFLIFKPVFPNPLADKFGPKAEEQPTENEPAEEETKVKDAAASELENDELIQKLNETMAGSDSETITDVETIEKSLLELDYSGINLD